MRESGVVGESNVVGMAICGVSQFARVGGCGYTAERSENTCRLKNAPGGAVEQVSATHNVT